MSSRTRSPAPSTDSAESQSIASAMPGGLSSSSVRTRPRNCVVDAISGSFAAGTDRRRISAARGGAGKSIQW